MAQLMGLRQRRRAEATEGEPRAMTQAHRGHRDVLNHERSASDNDSRVYSYGPGWKCRVRLVSRVFRMRAVCTVSIRLVI